MQTGVGTKNLVYVHDPIRRHSERGAFRAHLERVDLSGVEPWHTQDPHAEGGEEHEEECYCYGAVVVRVAWIGSGECEYDRDDYPASGTGGCGGHHHAPAAIALYHEVGEDGE